ncbi:MAG: DUF1501 domain-containing protein [Flavobacteriales bacterium]|jgi:uncharacterized protein (DUF1501 family)|nr:DUF1501 domain-containing protein [Flavobacteriales bacterium]
MKRRKFLKNTSLVAASPVLLNGIPISAFAENNLPIDPDCINHTDRCIVLIQMGGGNDGLNTVIPIDQFAVYSQTLRPTIHIEETEAIKLQQDPDDASAGNRDDIALHPALSGFRNIYNNSTNLGLGMSIIQNVGYPVQTKSHFRSTDLILEGRDGKATSPTSEGWIARYLYNNHEDAILAETLQDPLAVQLGKTNPSKGLSHTHNVTDYTLNLSGQNPLGLFTITNVFSSAHLGTIPNSDYGSALQHVKDIEEDLDFYATRMNTVFNAGANSAVTYPNTSLAYQLKTVAKLISGGSKTKIFVCHHGGFDTHSGQANRHNNVLGQLSAAVESFYQDLNNLTDDLGKKYSERVITATYSEFGRKAKQNGNHGTDHGSLFPMFVFGKGVKSQMVGNTPNLSNLTNSFQLQGMEHDYRAVFATILQDWLGSSDSVVDIAFKKHPSNANQSFLPDKIDLLKANSIACKDADEVNDGSVVSARKFITEDYDINQNFQLEVYPNPAYQNFMLDIESNTEEKVIVQVINAQGKVLISKTTEIHQGENSIACEVKNFSGLAVIKVYTLDNQLVGAKNLLIRR